MRLVKGTAAVAGLAATVCLTDLRASCAQTELSCQPHLQLSSGQPHELSSRHAHSESCFLLTLCRRQTPAPAAAAARPEQGRTSLSQSPAASSSSSPAAPWEPLFLQHSCHSQHAVQAAQQRTAAAGLPTCGASWWVGPLQPSTALVSTFLVWMSQQSSSTTEAPAQMLMLLWCSSGSCVDTTASPPQGRVQAPVAPCQPRSCGWADSYVRIHLIVSSRSLCTHNDEHVKHTAFVSVRAASGGLAAVGSARLGSSLAQLLSAGATCAVRASGT